MQENADFGHGQGFVEGLEAGAAVMTLGDFILAPVPLPEGPAHEEAATSQPTVVRCCSTNAHPLLACCLDDNAFNGPPNTHRQIHIEP